MESEFWLERWKTGNTPFHRSEANTALVAHFEKLGLAKGARVFVPLCGKTLDIGWLLGQGCRVAGAELSALAVDALFEELGVTPDVDAGGPLERYAAEGLDIFVGDIFDLTREALGPVHAVYDRAALIALPPGMRQRYAAHMTRIAARAPQLLLGLEYDQSQMDGPPFSVMEEEVRALYSGTYEVTLLARTEIPWKLREIVTGFETVWMLDPRG